MAKRFLVLMLFTTFMLVGAAFAANPEMKDNADVSIIIAATADNNAGMFCQASQTNFLKENAKVANTEVTDSVLNMPNADQMIAERAQDQANPFKNEIGNTKNNTGKNEIVANDKGAMYPATNCLYAGIAICTGQTTANYTMKI
jgi:hypothetical protein